MRSWNIENLPFRALFVPASDEVVSSTLAINRSGVRYSYIHISSLSSSM